MFVQYDSRTKRAIVYIHSTNRQVFVSDMQCVYCEEGTHFPNKIHAKALLLKPPTRLFTNGEMPLQTVHLTSLNPKVGQSCRIK